MTDVNEVFEDEADETTEKEVEGEVIEVKGEEETEPPAVKEPTLVPIAALHDERRKRAEAEERAASLEKQIPRKVEAPDMYEDPDAYKQWVKDEALREIRETETAEYEKKVETSRSSMLEKHEDYEQMEKAFVFLCGYDSSLIEEMRGSKNPALFAYEKGQEYLNSQKEALVAELIASGYTKKEAKEEVEETAKKVVNAPSLVTATSVASNSTPVEQEESFNEMFDDQGY